MDRKQVYLSANLQDAHIVKATLEGQGIPTEIRGEALQGAIGELPMGASIQPTLWVYESDFDQAKRIIESSESEEYDSTPWICDACGEQNEKQFSECWKCHNPDTKEEQKPNDKITEAATFHSLNQKPKLTICLTLMTILAFSKIYATETSTPYSELAKIGYLGPYEIYEGRFWGLFTTVWIHLTLVSVLFSIGWFVLLGQRVERVIGSVKWLCVSIIAIFVCESIQLTTFGNTSGGLSSLIYAAIGFVFATNRGYKTQWKVPDVAILGGFGLTLYICIILSYQYVYFHLGYGHFASLLLGVCFGGIFVTKRHVPLATGTVTLLCTVSVVSLFWSPWSPTWQISQSKAAANAGKYGVALESADRAIHIDPELIEANLEKAWLLTVMGDCSGALKIYRTVRREPDYSASIDAGRANAHYCLAEYEEAIARTTDALAADPTYSYSFGTRGMAYLQTSRHEKAISDFSSALSIDDQDSYSLIGRGIAKLETSNLNDAKVDLERAVIILSQQIKDTPNDAYSYSLKGLALSKLGDNDAAIEELTTAIEMNPVTGLYVARGESYIRSKDFQRAVSDFNREIEKFPRNDFAYLGLGIAKYKSGNIEEGLSYLSNSLAINPESFLTYHHLGAVYELLGRYTDSLSNLDQAIKLNPRYKASYEIRARVKKAMGDSDGAKRDLARAADLKGNTLEK